MSCEDCISRRQFLKVSSAIAIAAPAAGLLTRCNQTPLASGAGAGNVIVIPSSPNSVYTFPFSQYPQLQTIGQSLHVSIQDSAHGTKDVFITSISSTTADTVSTICTHAGCTLNAYDPSQSQYLCLCHGSEFNADGSVKQGPATVALPAYATVVTTTGVQVTIS